MPAQQEDGYEVTMAELVADMEEAEAGDAAARERAWQEAAGPEFQYRGGGAAGLAAKEGEAA